MPFSALYDANVLYPFEIRDVLMVAARTGVFRVLWSDDILDECARNLIKDGRATQDNMDRMTPEQVATYLAEGEMPESGAQLLKLLKSR